MEGKTHQNKVARIYGICNFFGQFWQTQVTTKAKVSQIMKLVVQAFQHHWLCLKWRSNGSEKWGGWLDKKWWKTFQFLAKLWNRVLQFGANKPFFYCWKLKLKFLFVLLFNKKCRQNMRLERQWGKTTLPLFATH